MSQSSLGQALLIGNLVRALIFGGAASLLACTSVVPPNGQPSNIPLPSKAEAINELFNVETEDETIKTEDNYISSIWFSKEFMHGQDAYYVVFTKSQALTEDGETESCHACSAEIGAITYKKTENQWEVVSKEKNITSFGAWGDVPDLDVEPEAINLSPAVTAFLLESGYTNQGYTIATKSVFSFSGDLWEDIGSVRVHENNAGACGSLEPCWGYDGTVFVAVEQQIDYPDLLIVREGTIRNDAGEIAKPENIIYKHDGNSYANGANQ